MSRDFHVDCSAYDRLLVRLSPPKGCVTRVAVATDRGPRAFVSEPAAENRAEYVLDLQGARCIETITLELETGAEGGAAGWLTWIGLQNSERLAQYFDQWDYSGMKWDAYLGRRMRPAIRASLRCIFPDGRRVGGPAGQTRIRRRRSGRR